MSEQQQQCPHCGQEHATGDVITCFANLNAQIQGDWQPFLGSGLNVMTAIGYYDTSGKVVFLVDCAPDWFYKGDHKHLSDHRKMLNWILMAREALPQLRNQLRAAEARLDRLTKALELAAGWIEGFTGVPERDEAAIEKRVNMLLADADREMERERGELS